MPRISRVWGCENIIKPKKGCTRPRKLPFDVKTLKLAKKVGWTLMYWRLAGLFDGPAYRSPHPKKTFQIL